MKKFLTGILATLCVGVAVCGVATDAVTANAAQLVYERESLENPPACVLTLEEPKIKNMTAWDYCRVDDEYDAWYFYGDGSASANPEIRFIVDGVQTVTKPYTLVPMDVGSFSFEYTVVNDSIAKVEDLTTARYIVQILASDGSYPILEVDIEEDGDWHKITVTGATPIYRSEYPYTAYQNKFCGFLFKMGGLDGELMIRDIRLYDLSGDEILSESELPDGGEDSSSEEVSSEETSSEIESSFDIPELVTSQSSTAESASNTNVSKGCGSFGVGAMSLGALAAAGLVLGVSKKKRK